MLENIKQTENSLIFVNFMTGMTAALLATLLFIILKVDISTADIGKINFNFSSIDVFLIVAFVFIGFFVYGIRYYFFELYRVKIFKKVKYRQDKKNEKRKLNPKMKSRKPDKEEGHTPCSWFIKYAFRNGTTVEEAIAAWKKAKEGDKSIFDWIKQSQSASDVSFDMWKYANFINNRHPKANIYRFYYHSEIFQCLDSLFLLMFIIVACVFVTFIVIQKSVFNIQTIFLFAYTVLLFLFHKVSKETGKACIRRFFLEIAVGLTDCEDINLK